MSDIDFPHPLRVIVGSHEPGSGEGCAMNVISYENGDTEITDYPDCSARPLARLVQIVNDRICSHGDGRYLCPECSVKVVGLGRRTVGTADTTEAQTWAWLAELLDSPEWGVIRFDSTEKAVKAVRCVADLCRRAATGDAPGRDEWRTARDAAYASASAAAYAAYASASASASDAAYAAYASASDAAVDAVDAADAAYAYAYADGVVRLAIAHKAIDAWLRITGKNEVTVAPEVTAAAVEKMLAVTR